MSETPGIEPERPMIEFMSIEVWTDKENLTFEGISEWVIDQFGHLRIRRQDLDVAVFVSGKWRMTQLRYKFNDGSWIDAHGQGGPTEQVAVGITVNAIGGRSS